MEQIAKSVLHYCNVSLEKCQPISERMIDYYDFTFVLEGEMIYYANGERLVLQRNDAILLPPKTLRARAERRGAVRYVSFNFGIAQESGLPLPIFIRDGITQEMRNAVMNFPLSHVVPNNLSREKCIALLNYLLFCLLDGKEITTKNEHVLEMLRYIDDKITERITLKRISEQVGLTREYASALFKREMNLTLTDYVNGQKLELARAMILGNEISLSDISSALGFENYHYFSRIFKQKFGTSPMQFKKA